MPTAEATAVPLTTALERFAPETVATSEAAVVQFRRARSPGYAGPPTHVLLHGIGSASGSWISQLLAASRNEVSASHVLAWDAPGYGGSTALPLPEPDAADYALRMWAWLDATGSAQSAPITLVGHSLGALMAARAALQQPARIARLVLLAPAQGYARATPAVREQKLADRLANLQQLGPAGMARKRAAAMLSADADSSLVGFVEATMAGIWPDGYTQAARMLAHGDLLQDLAQLSCPVLVASGNADTVTPPQGCRAMADSVGAPYVSLGQVGHSCALEAAAQVNRLIGVSGEPP